MFKALLKYSTQKLNIIFLLCFIVEVAAFLRFPKQTWGEGLLHTWYMSKGLVIYKDIASEYFPLFFWFTLVLHKIFGFTQTLTIVLSPIVALSSLVVVFLLSKRWLSGWNRVVPLIYFVFWDVLANENHFSTNPFLGLINILALFFLMSWFRKPKVSMAALVGLFLGIGFYSYQMQGFFVMIVFLSIIYQSIRDKLGWISVFSSIGVFLSLGLLIATVLWSQGALSAFYFWNIKWYLIGGYTFDRIGKGFEESLLLFSATAPVLLIGLSFFVKSRILNQSQKVFVFLLALNFPLTFWFATMHRSRLTVVMSVFAFLFGLGLELLKNSDRKVKLFSRFLIGGIIGMNILSFFIVMVPIYKSRFGVPWKYNIITKVNEGDTTDFAIKWLKANTDDRDRVFVLDNELIYLESNRLPSSARAVTALPFVYVPLEDFKNELRTYTPDYWIIDEGQKKRFYDFGYGETAEVFWQMLECEPVVAKYQSLTIREHVPGSQLCI